MRHGHHAGLQTLALLLPLTVLGCGNDACPPGNYPISYDGWEDHQYFRGTASSDDSGSTNLFLLPEFDDASQPTGRYEFLLGPCRWVVEPVGMCDASSDGVVSMLIVEPAGWTCEWTTVGGDLATFDGNSQTIWWGPDQLEITISGPVTYTGGGTSTGSAIFSFSGSAP